MDSRLSCNCLSLYFPPESSDVSYEEESSEITDIDLQEIREWTPAQTSPFYEIARYFYIKVIPVSDDEKRSYHLLY
jgi:hypothetical protein